jgi:hypothetical protein
MIFFKFIRALVAIKIFDYLFYKASSSEAFFKNAFSSSVRK